MIRRPVFVLGAASTGFLAGVNASIAATDASALSAGVAGVLVVLTVFNIVAAFSEDAKSGL